MVIPLVLDIHHICLPDRYDGRPYCGYDIALFRIPDEYQDRVLAYMTS